MTILIYYPKEMVKDPKNWVSTQRGNIPCWDPSNEIMDKTIKESGYSAQFFYTEDNPEGCYFLTSPDFERDLNFQEQTTIINNCRIDKDFFEIF